METGNRTAKILLLLAGFVVVLCVGMVVGGAVVYGVTQIGGILPDLAAEFRGTRADRFVVEPEFLDEAGDLLAPLGTSGVVVVRVEEGSPAEAAGLEVGDQILAVDGQDLGLDGNLAELIGGYEPGDRITLEVKRPGEAAREIRVRLGESPDDADRAWLGIGYSQTRGLAPLEGGPGALRRFRQLDPERLEELVPGLEALQGVVIMDVAEDSPAAGAGLESGDAILAIDGEPVARPQELSAAIAGHKPGDRITLTVMSMADAEHREVEVSLAEHPDSPGAGYLGVFLGGGFRFERQRSLPEDEEGWNFNFEGVPFRFRLPLVGEDNGGWIPFGEPSLEEASL